ncbi:serine hydrolase domain-containing protein [Microbacterium sp. B2969]|uniref:Serine hydrolase domain-containing protein n=1 Tax=Microbacterium alkaliflavum TaxID=3248839 RepID=A0ABW7Q6S6_9MICO
MARLTRHAVPRLVDACVAVVCVCAVVGCTAPPSARPSPAELVQADLDGRLSAVEVPESLRAVLIDQHGTPVLAQYFSSTPEDAWDVQSVTKSVTSTLVGIAIDRGLVPGVDATLGELLPDYSAYLNADTARIRLSAVLTDTANFVDDPAVIARGVTTDWVAAILEARAAEGRGMGSFRPSSHGAHILAAVVAEATGMSPLAFARETLFEPLEIDSVPAPTERLGVDAATISRRDQAAEAPAWPADPQGINVGNDQLRLRPAELMHLGQLFLDDGDWRGLDVVSTSWVEAATSSQARTTMYGSMSFGYQWWVDAARGQFAALDDGGTVILVDRRKDAVAVIATEALGSSGLPSAQALALAQTLLEDLPG